MSRPVIVTDSTATLAPEVCEQRGIVVVPLQVVIGATSYDEGVATPDMVAAALKEWTPVSTSRPNPAAFLEAYEKAAADGATEVLSIHVSSAMSGTHESAEIAARDASIPVTVLDSGHVGIGVGYAVLAAAEVLDAGGGVAEARDAAVARLARTRSLFYVDTLEYLRRGGRVNAVAALIGGALAVKPLLQIEEGRIVPVEKVRTAGKALARLAELAAEGLDGQAVSVAVAHLAAKERAVALSERVAERLDVVGELQVVELGAVLGAHAGPGMVAVSVAPALESDIAAHGAARAAAEARAGERQPVDEAVEAEE
jgi:DegV family protein with EDD domain